jgi:hypothetical protein
MAQSKGRTDPGCPQQHGGRKPQSRLEDLGKDHREAALVLSAAGAGRELGSSGLGSAVGPEAEAGLEPVVEAGQLGEEEA